MNKKIDIGHQITVAFYQKRFCTRAIKEAVALRPYVKNLIGITADNELTSKSQEERLDKAFSATYSGVKGIDDFLSIVRKNKIGIVHCHNFPDTATLLAIEARKAGGRHRVIHDIHDHGTLQYVTLTDEQKQQECKAEAGADGFVFVSEATRSCLFNIRGLGRKPSCVIYSKPNYDMFSSIPVKRKFFLRAIRFLFRGKQLRFVYQGGIHSIPGHHRNTMMAFRKICEADHYLTVYSSTLNDLSSSSQRKIYEEHVRIDPLRLRVKEVVPLHVLYKKLLWFDAGVSILAGNSSPYQKLTIPNKIFEYAACGLPTVVDSTSDAVTDYVKKNNMGMIVDNWKNFAADDLLRLESNFGNHRFRFSMEYEIGKLIELYNKVR